MAERKYLIRGKSLTAAQVGELENATEEEMRQFAQQAGLTDARLNELTGMVEALAPIVKDYVVKSVQTLADRLLLVETKVVELEDRILELEERPPADWEVYDAAKTYKAGNFVTYAGSMFFARAESRGVKPGTGDACWKLCVKRGSVS